MRFTPEFVNKVHRIFGDKGRAWLPQLPEILARCREQWHLPEGVPCSVVAMNYIEFTTTPGGEPVALKVGVPHEELYTEMEALSLYNGHGAARVLASDRELGAILMQRAVPGTMLWRHGDNREQTRIAAGVMRALPVPEPEQHGMPHFSRWVERAFRLTRAEWDPDERMPRDLLDRAEAAFIDLARDRSSDVVLHGDLHHENILWDEADGWIAIDPKGVIGPRSLEVGRYMQNQLPDDAPFAVHEQLVRERIEIFSEVLGLAPETVAAASLVDCVLSHVWSFEDEGPLREDWYRGIELARLLCDILPSPQSSDSRKESVNMVPYRIVERPAFVVAGQSTWISGQGNEEFGHFWAQCRTDGTLERLQSLAGPTPGVQTQGYFLGVSRVEADPANRAFGFMVTVEVPEDTDLGDLESCNIPACRWAVFEAHGPVPQALVAAEMYAFMEWLPVSGYVHALAPELEVYPPSPDDQPYCEFWLPIAVPEA